MTWKFNALRFTRKQLTIVLAAAGFLASAVIFVVFVFPSGSGNHTMLANGQDTASGRKDSHKNGTGNHAVGTCTSLIKSGKLAGAQLAKALRNRGIAYAELGQHARAIQDFDRAIAAEPDDAIAFNNRGNAYKALGQYARAIKDYDRAIKLESDYTEAFYNRGVAKKKIGDVSGGNADIEKAKKLNPGIGK